MPRSRYKIYENQHPHFLTCTIIGWIPLFSSPPLVEIIYNSWRFLQKHNRLEIYAYVIMENHLHLIATSTNLAKEMGDFKSFTARQIIDYLTEKNAHHVLEQLAQAKAKHKRDRKYQVWQEGYHAQQILDERMMRQKVEYIHYNPVKRGYVDEPTHWRYSSARNYNMQNGLLGVIIDW